MINDELIQKAMELSKDKNGKVTVNTLKSNLHVGIVTANLLLDKLNELGLLNLE